MLTFLRIERPTSATLRPFFSAACTTCWTRWMFDAKQVTTMRPCAAREHAVQVRADDRLAVADAGRSTFVESPHSSSRPSRPSSARRAMSAGAPPTGVWSNL
jgi:hypothetical protein